MRRVVVAVVSGVLNGLGRMIGLIGGDWSRRIFGGATAAVTVGASAAGRAARGSLLGTAHGEGRVVG